MKATSLRVIQGRWRHESGPLRNACLELARQIAALIIHPREAQVDIREELLLRLRGTAKEF